jgi:hypothetical protein
MVDEKSIKFFDGVLSKTRDGKIPRGPTAQESNFIAAIGGQFSLSISGPTEFDSMFTTVPALVGSSVPGQRYVLILRDMSSTIATLTDSEEGMRPGAMRELYERARWQAVHGGEKINRAIEVLQTL